MSRIPTVTEMLLAILSICSKEELLTDNWSDDEDGREAPSVADVPLSSRRREQIKSKIRAVGRMQKVFQLLRCVFVNV
jgi:serine/threonine-protein phosphatase 2B catalytic subunit